ncbi:hypothetical protein ACN28S_19990 [Cystobacter fuscus]
MLLLSTDLEQQRDGEGRHVGYLGRAHPLVRRALDRVRNLQLGAGGGTLDRRVSAVRGDGSEPEVLLTFLGRVESGTGPELERVLAVQLGREGEPVVMASAADWERFVSTERGMPTAGQWERHFQDWAPRRQEDARTAALSLFEALTHVHAERHAEALATERLQLEQWLRARTEALCGSRRAVQAQLFEQTGGQDLERWRMMENDTERLAAFATDAGQPIRARREAEGVLELYRRRTNELDRRGQLTPCRESHRNAHADSHGRGALTDAIGSSGLHLLRPGPAGALRPVRP